MIERFHSLCETYDPITGSLTGGSEVVRKLSQLEGVFYNNVARDALLAESDPVVYRVVAVEPASESGDLHYGLGTIYPGKVGNEYFLTKGHLHCRREAAEVYIGLSGEGMMLLEDEKPARADSKLSVRAGWCMCRVTPPTGQSTLALNR